MNKQILLGIVLKQYREHYGWTLKQVAQKSKVSSAHISVIERGKVSPTVRTLNKITKALKVNIQEFINIVYE